MKVKRRIVIVLAAALAIIIMTAMGVYAADYEVLETDVPTPSDDCVMLGVYGSYHSDAQDALNRINEIRREACYDGKTPDPRNPSKMLNSTDYVPMKWSTSLEKIARIRSVEGGIAVGHVRHNGKSIYGITYGGINTSGENLAYNYSSSMVYSVNRWYSERNDWVAQNEGKVTGHYTSLINPSYKYVGLGLFGTEAGAYPYSCAGEFSSSEGSLGTTFLNAPKNVMQKIEVKEAYIDEYYINQRADLNLT